MAVEKAGADFIVAQGIEAGGHRGIFNPDDADEKLTTVELTKQLVRGCSIPVIAAGAIMDGADIAKALRSGAVAAQLGTAFLCCEESGATPAHKEYLLKHHSRGSAFPIQNTLTASLRQLGGKTNNGEYQSLWAGQDYSRTRALSAKNLMLALKEELTIALSL
jgi:nitronate monooxygenase